LLEEKKKRTLEYLKEDKAREVSAAAMRPIDEEDVNTDDEEKGEHSKEFEEWQLRELQRIKRDREEREKQSLEKAAIEARRGMTDEEVIAEKRRMKDGVKERKKIKFLQKYYHKGAFYNEELGKVETTVEHDWAAPTGDDKYVDRSMLPKVMQVKNFGRSGRTKYTHLRDQDTSNIEDPFSQKFVPERIGKHLGGVGTGFERPTKKRKIEPVEQNTLNSYPTQPQYPVQQQYDNQNNYGQQWGYQQ